jgi:hypothetical protein
VGTYRGTVANNSYILFVFNVQESLGGIAEVGLADRYSSPEAEKELTFF